MPKDIPECPPKPTPKAAAVHHYEIELVTPMFGGGVEPRLNDPTFSIRATAIRGQLQFWWRATVGAQYETLADLRAAQTEVWGSTERASPVQVRVELLDLPSDPKACAVIRPNNNDRDRVVWESPFSGSALPYALFPFQGKPANNEGPKVEPSSCIHKLKFRLTVICSENLDFATQVEPAIWAWVNFGGLGSRTRRGCGAVYCSELAPENLESIDDWYRGRIPVNSFGVREWPTLPTHFLSYRQSGKPYEQWNQVICLLRDFRQKAGNDPGHARPPGPDRSWYPEPDTIRRITGSHSPGHDPSRHLSGGNPLPDGFPRAEFGLPIVFKFIDDKLGDPKQTTLQPHVGGIENDLRSGDSPGIHSIGGETRGRMASPVILKPLALSKDAAVAIIMPLQTKGVDRVVLLNKNGNDLTAGHNVPVRNIAFAKYHDSPVRGLTDTGSALEAFLRLAVQPSASSLVHPNTGYRRVPE